MVSLMTQHIPHIPLGAAGQAAAHRLCRCVQVSTGVHGLEDAQVVAEVVDEGSPLIRVVLWLNFDGPVEALQPLTVNACRWKWDSC